MRLNKSAALLSILSSMLLTGCVMNKPIHNMQSELDVKEYLPYAKAGSSTVKGQAFLKRNDGQVVTCAGNKVMLFPDVAYSNEMFAAIMHGETVEANDSQRLKDVLIEHGIKGKIARESICDAQGNFVFAKLPAARWRIATDVKWFVGTVQGGGLLKATQTTPNTVTEVILTDIDLVR